MKWRILPLRIDDPYTSMAIDEAILKLNAEGDVPNTIRFWRWDPSAVSLGCFQSLELEVDLDKAKKYGFEVVRRITGGGAVFHDHDGELTYSIICSEDDVPKDIIKSYEKICGGIIEGLKNIGLEAEYKPVNDILYNGKKISGSAQTRRFGSVLQHGTILIDPDIRKMFEILKVSQEKISDKFINSVYQRVTSLNRELNDNLDFNEIREAMIMGFENVFDVDLVFNDLYEDEKELTEKLREKYSSPDWIRKR